LCNAANRRVGGQGRKTGETGKQEIPGNNCREDENGAIFHGFGKDLFLCGVGVEELRVVVCFSKPILYSDYRFGNISIA
jgi:hypothetical protein